MDSNLGFLREALSNHLENHKVCQEIYRKLEANEYKNEEEFAEDLEVNENRILNLILQYELDYARQEKDDLRLQRLNGVYEQLF